MCRMHSSVVSSRSGVRDDQSKARSQTLKMNYPSSLQSTHLCSDPFFNFLAKIYSPSLLLCAFSIHSWEMTDIQRAGWRNDHVM